MGSYGSNKLKFILTNRQCFVVESTGLLYESAFGQRGNFKANKFKSAVIEPIKETDLVLGSTKPANILVILTGGYIESNLSPIPPNPHNILPILRVELLGQICLPSHRTRVKVALFLSNSGWFLR